MAGKHQVCQGAQCKCQFGTTPDKLKVLSHTKEYINDNEGSTKLTASTKDIGTTFEKNTFGSCAKQNNKPCNATVTEWKGFYDKITLSNGGKVLLEDSKATCPIGGADCIEITNHGQKASMTQQEVKSADDAVMATLYPFGKLNAEATNKQIPRTQ